MKVSIITACRNSAATIEDTIRSVVFQDYPAIEYILIDGGSSDDTLKIAGQYKSHIPVFLSEKDRGIYDALNKGIDRAGGDIVAILHSDDFYAVRDVVSRVVTVFKNTGCEAVYGDLQYVDKDNTSKVLRYWRSGEYREGLFLKGWMPPHPAFFVKRECYRKYGNFNTDLMFAADYELMLRFIHKYKIRLAYMPEVLVRMRAGGKSNKTLMNRIKANLEDRRAWKINGLKPYWTTLIRKPLSKITQFCERR